MVQVSAQPAASPSPSSLEEEESLLGATPSVPAVVNGLIPVAEDGTTPQVPCPAPVARRTPTTRAAATRLVKSCGGDPPPVPVGMRKSITFQAEVSTAEGTDSAEVQTLKANHMGLWSQGGNKIAELTKVVLDFEDTAPLRGSFVRVGLVLRPRGVGTSIRLRFLDPLECNAFVEFFHRRNKNWSALRVLSEVKQ